MRGNLGLKTKNIINLQDETFDEILSDFKYDLRRWKTRVKHMENEIVFLERLLASEAFGKVLTRTMREKRELFKKMIRIKADFLADFKAELDSYQVTLTKLASTDHLRKNKVHVERHETLNIRFEKFCKDFDDFRAKVLIQTGSIL